MDTNKLKDIVNHLCNAIMAEDANQRDRMCRYAKQAVYDQQSTEPFYANGYYKFTSERSTCTSMAEHLNGDWFLIGEEGEFTLTDLAKRGWVMENLIALSNK